MPVSMSSARHLSPPQPVSIHLFHLSTGLVHLVRPPCPSTLSTLSTLFTRPSARSPAAQADQTTLPSPRPPGCVIPRHHPAGQRTCVGKGEKAPTSNTQPPSPPSFCSSSCSSPPSPPPPPPLRRSPFPPLPLPFPLTPWDTSEPARPGILYLGDSSVKEPSSSSAPTWAFAVARLPRALLRVYFMSSTPPSHRPSPCPTTCLPTSPPTWVPFPSCRASIPRGRRRRVSVAPARPGPALR